MKKDFDCVEMMHQGALRIYEETKDLTYEQEVEYWRRKSDDMMRRIEREKSKASAPEKTGT